MTVAAPPRIFPGPTLAQIVAALEVKAQRHVRTPQGSRFYKLPIGAPIPPGHHGGGTSSLPHTPSTPSASSGPAPLGGPRVVNQHGHNIMPGSTVRTPSGQTATVRTVNPSKGTVFLIVHGGSKNRQLRRAHTLELVAHPDGTGKPGPDPTHPPPAPDPPKPPAGTSMRVSRVGSLKAGDTFVFPVQRSDRHGWAGKRVTVVSVSKANNATSSVRVRDEAGRERVAHFANSRQVTVHPSGPAPTPPKPPDPPKPPIPDPTPPPGPTPDPGGKFVLNQHGHRITAGAHVITPTGQHATVRTVLPEKGQVFLVVHGGSKNRQLRRAHTLALADPPGGGAPPKPPEKPAPPKPAKPAPPKPPAPAKPDLPAPPPPPDTSVPAHVKAARDATAALGDPQLIGFRAPDADADRSVRQFEVAVERSREEERAYDAAIDGDFSQLRALVKRKGTDVEPQFRTAWDRWTQRERNSRIADWESYHREEGRPSRTLEMYTQTASRQTSKFEAALGQHKASIGRLTASGTPVPDVDPNDKGPSEAVQAHLDAVMTAGKAVDDEVERRLAERTAGANAEADALRVRETDIMKQTVALAKELNKEQWGSPKYREISARYNALETERVSLKSQRMAKDRTNAGERRKVTLEVLSEIRKMGPSEGGGHTLNASVPPPARPRRGRTSVVTDPAELTAAAQWAEQHYPEDWVSLAAAHSPLRLERTARGYYSHVGSTIALSSRDESKVGGPVFDRVAVHEMGHRMESTVPGVQALEWAYHWSRTSEGPVGKRKRTGKNALRGMAGYSRTEKAREDEYPLAYSGKEYPTPFSGGAGEARQSWEILTTSAESIFSGSTYTDASMRQFTLGMLASLPGKPKA